MPPHASHASTSAGHDRARPLPRDMRPIELFDAWMYAEADAGIALMDWLTAPYDRKADAYVAYTAALDREAQAAGLLQARLAIDAA